MMRDKNVERNSKSIVDKFLWECENFRKEIPSKLIQFKLLHLYINWITDLFGSLWKEVWLNKSGQNANKPSLKRKYREIKYFVPNESFCEFTKLQMRWDFIKFALSSISPIGLDLWDSVLKETAIKIHGNALL